MTKKNVDLNEIDKFENKYKGIVEGTKKIISGDISEIDDLPEIFFESEYSERFFKNISDGENFKYNYELINRAYEGRNSEKLLNKIIERKRKRRDKLLYTLSSSAVAALVVISFLTYYSGDRLFPEMAENNINSEKNENIFVPTIFTEDNRHITLDTVAKKTTVKELTKLSSPKKTSVLSVVKEQKLVVPSGYTYTIILEDSSEVTLNAASELIYPIIFNDSTRLVKFNGEGYFKIKKGSKPFIVNCNGVDIKVYGTEFNIKSRDSIKMETLLVDGSVGVSIKGEREVKMEPNQILLYEKSCNRIELKEVNVAKYLQWMEGNFNYDKYPLKYILKDLESWYNVRFETERDIENINLTFFTAREREITKILNVIERISNVKFKNEGGDIFIVANI